MYCRLLVVYLDAYWTRISGSIRHAQLLSSYQQVDHMAYKILQMQTSSLGEGLQARVCVAITNRHVTRVSASIEFKTRTDFGSY